MTSEFMKNNINENNMVIFFPLDIKILAFTQTNPMKLCKQITA